MSQIIKPNMGGSGGTDLHTALYIVGKTLTYGANYTVISDAIAAAVAAGVNATIFIQPGTYTESFQMYPGISLSAYPCDSLTPNVIINGFLTIVLGGDYSISNICFSTTAVYTTSALVIEASDADTITNTDIFNCSFNTIAAGTKAISEGSLNAASKTNFFSCNFDVTQNNSWHFSKNGAGSLFFFDCNFANAGDSTVANDCSVGVLNITNCSLANQLTLSETCTGTFTNMSIDCSAQNQVAITSSNTANFGLHFCRLVSGTASSISIGAGSTISAFNTELNSSNINVITGTGTLNYSLITFSGSSSGHNVTTENAFPYIPFSSSPSNPIAFTATLANTLTNILGDNSQYLVVFDTVNQTATDFSTSTGLFTAPSTAWYNFNYCITCIGLTIDQTTNFTTFIINGNIVEFTSPICNPFIASATGYYGISGSLTVKLNVGDTIGVLAQINGSTKVVSLLGDQNFSPVGHYCYFSGSSIAGSSSSNDLVIIKSATVDMTSATSQLLLTTSSNPFIVSEVIEFANNINTKVGNATFNIGWTPTGYDDLINGTAEVLSSSNTATNYINFQDISGNPSGVIPASTSVYINIMAASTAVTDTQTFYILGYYLF